MAMRDTGNKKRGRPPKVAASEAEPGAKKASAKNGSTSDAVVGFEEKLWQMADKLRNNMDAAEYKHVVLGLIFLKYISDAFEEKHTALAADKKSGADPEDPDEYRADNIYWVPKEARWSHLQGNAKQATIGKLIDDAMVALEAQNPTLKGVLQKDYGRPGLDKTRLGELIDLVGTIGLGDRENRARDVLGRVYEYFLTKFAAAEGKNGGQFYTPRGVVRVLVEMLAPYKGRVFDPACGSGGMFISSEKFVEAHGGRVGDISIYGQESNHTTWRLAKLNLAIRGIDANIVHGDTFHADGHKDLKADYVLANPPFNDSDWGQPRLKEDVRWKYGVPPAGNANFAWVQHFLHHLAPTGIAGFVLANGSMSSQQSGEGEIRKSLVEADLVDCMVALPGQLFYSTQHPGLPLVPRARQEERPRRPRQEDAQPPEGDPLHRCAKARHDRRPRAPRAERSRRRPHRRHLPPLARRRRGQVRGCGRLLQERDDRRDRRAPVRAHARALRRRGGGRGRRRAVRREDEAVGRDVGAAVRGRGAVGAGDSEEPAGVGVWGLSGATGESVS